jgi:uncharacterized protein DUF5362
MGENQTTSLFGLSIDPTSKAHLSEAAKWAKFLAIVGFILMGLMVLVFIFAGAFWGAMSSGISSGETITPTAGLRGSFQFFFLFAMIALYFFPCLFLFHFANKMKKALAADDQATLNTSFQNLKKFFRFIGILTVIVLALYAVIICVTLLGVGLGR